MAVRRINYTGRRRLSQEDIRVSILRSSPGALEFHAELSLGDYGLPGAARMSVEAYRQTSWMRFPCGTVDSPRLPDDRRLEEFDSPDGVLFRVRVTSAEDPEGLLLAEADQIQPRLPEDQDEDRVPLLPAKSDHDLGEQVFRVDFSDRPILLINARVGDWRSVASDPVFVSLVLPAAMREVLTRILHVDKHFDSEDLEDWRSQWLRFCTRLPGVPASPAQDASEDHVDDWIVEAVSAFCRRFDTYRRFGRYLTGEASE